MSGGFPTIRRQFAPLLRVVPQRVGELGQRDPEIDLGVQRGDPGTRQVGLGIHQLDCRRALGSAPWGDALWKETIDGGQDCHWLKLLREEVDIARPPFTTRYPELVGFLNPQPGQPRISRARNNVLVRCGESTSGNWKIETGQVWATEADPGFENLGRGDLRLRPDSEVFRRLPGFQPIPFEKIGLQDRRAE